MLGVAGWRRHSSQDRRVSDYDDTKGEIVRSLQQCKPGAQGKAGFPALRVTYLRVLFRLANPRTKWPAPAAARNRTQYRRVFDIAGSFHGSAHLSRTVGVRGTGLRALSHLYYHHSCPAPQDALERTYFLRNIARRPARAVQLQNRVLLSSLDGLFPGYIFSTAARITTNRAGCWLFLRLIRDASFRIESPSVPLRDPTFRFEMPASSPFVF